MLVEHSLANIELCYYSSPIFIEYEATFTGIGKDEARRLFTDKGTVLLRSEFLQKRIVLDLPKKHTKEKGFLRVRDEGDKITLTHKIVGTGGITDQRETCIVVNDFDNTVDLLNTYWLHISFI